MEKTIKLIMEEDKDIKILVGGDLKYTIEEQDRKITAQEIYDLIEYEIGDKYNVETENKKQLDAPVLNYFKELIKDICERINDLNFSEEEEMMNDIDVPD